MNYWLVKQEPTDWTGVRNYTARNHLREMKKGDKVFFYHSVVGKEIVGIAQVSKTEFPDPTDEKWTAVELKPVKALKKPVGLDQIKANKALANIYLVKQPRFSVMPLSKDEFEEILSMSK